MEAVVGQSEITFRLFDGTQAAAHADELRALHAEVCAGRPNGDDLFARRYRVLRRQPGFVLAEARHGGYLVGYAFGMPLRPSTFWWRHLTTPLPDDVTTEHPGRTFALVELAVRASWRRQGIAETLHDLILENRPEERATLTVSPTAVPAQQAFRKWGWRKVARTRDAEPGSPVSDVLVIALPAARLGVEDEPYLLNRIVIRLRSPRPSRFRREAHAERGPSSESFRAGDAIVERSSPRPA